MLTSWDPFTEMSRLQDELLRRSSTGAFSPAVDIYEEQDAIHMTVEVPGVNPEDIFISVEKGVLTVRGERKLERADQRSGYHRVERSYGSFTRSFVLPDYVDPERIEATCDAGVLRLRLAKQPAAQPRRIAVQTGTTGTAAPPQLSTRSNDGNRKDARR